MIGIGWFRNASTVGVSVYDTHLGRRCQICVRIMICRCGLAAAHHEGWCKSLDRYLRRMNQKSPRTRETSQRNTSVLSSEAGEKACDAESTALRLLLGIHRGRSSKLRHMWAECFRPTTLRGHVQILSSKSTGNANPQKGNNGLDDIRP